MRGGDRGIGLLPVVFFLASVMGVFAVNILLITASSSRGVDQARRALDGEALVNQALGRVVLAVAEESDPRRAASYDAVRGQIPEGVSLKTWEDESGKIPLPWMANAVPYVLVQREAVGWTVAEARRKFSAFASALEISLAPTGQMFDRLPLYEYDGQSVQEVWMPEYETLAEALPDWDIPLRFLSQLSSFITVMPIGRINLNTVKPGVFRAIFRWQHESASKSIVDSVVPIASRGFQDQGSGLKAEHYLRPRVRRQPFKNEDEALSEWNRAPLVPADVVQTLGIFWFAPEERWRPLEPHPVTFDGVKWTDPGSDAGYWWGYAKIQGPGSFGTASQMYRLTLEGGGTESTYVLELFSNQPPRVISVEQTP